MTVELDGSSLNLDDVVSVAVAGDDVRLTPAARERMQAHRAIVMDALARGDHI
jgi:histidine ammonia-lyase